MSALILALVLAGGFEVLWARVSSLRPYRWHFRGMLLLFWGSVLALIAIDRMNIVPGLFFEGIPKFASDAITYQRQADVLADRLRQGDIPGFGDDQLFNYSRILALLYVLLGNSPFMGSIFNAVFYMASVVAIFYVGRQLFNAQAGLVAAWLFAVSPTFLLHETQTLRWATTTAGLHVAVLGALVLPSSRRWLVGVVLGVMGFAVLVYDLPYIARLFVMTVAGFSVVPLFFQSLGRERWLIAVRFAAFALVLGAWYQWSWSTPGAPPEDVRIQEVHNRRETAAALALSAPAAPSAPSSAPGARASSTTTAYPSSSATVPAALPPPPPPMPMPMPMPEAGSFWEWFDARTARLDPVIAPALLARIGFIDQAAELRRAGIPLGTTIEAPELASFGEFVRNLPKAFRLVMFEPTISRLLSDSAGSSGVRRFAILEMIFYYAVMAASFAGVILAVWSGGRTRMRTLLILLLMAGAYALLGTTILNGGTLHRLRQPYVAYLCVFAAGAFTWLIERRRERMY